MLKINLSETSGEEQGREQANPAPAPEARAESAPPAPSKTKAPVRTSGKRRSVWPVFIGLLLIALIVAGAYLSWNSLSAYFGAPAQTVVPPAVTTPAPVSAPAPVVAAPKAEPEPVATLLSTLSNVIPAKIWLTGLALRYDGSYEIRGMAFTFPVMAELDSALVKLGTVAARSYPPKSSSSETVYQFAVSGKAAGFKVPDILDLISADKLAAAIAPILAKNGVPGVKFTATPQPGRTYGEQDLPFSLVGSYAGLRQVIGELCANNPDIRVYQLTIVSSGIGLPYDQVQARFSLRTKSSI